MYANFCETIQKGYKIIQQRDYWCIYNIAELTSVTDLMTHRLINSINILIHQSELHVIGGSSAVCSRWDGGISKKQCPVKNSVHYREDEGVREESQCF